jgi:hypothetical protein
VAVVVAVPTRTQGLVRMETPVEDLVAVAEKKRIREDQVQVLVATQVVLM